MIAPLFHLAALPESIRFGWALVHFLWQGALIAGLLEVALLFVHRAHAARRYLFCGAALALMPVCLIGTYLVLGWENPATAPGAIQAGAMMVSRPAAGSVPEVTSFPAVQFFAEPASGHRPPFDPNRFMPLVVLVWFAGVVILAGRKAGGFLVIGRLRHRGLSAPSDALLEQFRKLGRKLGVDPDRVCLRISTLVSVPMTMGWLKPIVLLPAVLLSGLTPDQLEAILAHELAHIRRHDYLVNLCQTVIETILFYHPAVWWISRKLREERENCCDDLALQIVGDKLTYATALAALEESRSLPMAITLAATGGSLLQRIRRLVGVNETKPFRWPLFLALIAIVLAGIFVGSYVWSGKTDLPSRGNAIGHVVDEQGHLITGATRIVHVPDLATVTITPVPPPGVHFDKIALQDRNAVGPSRFWALSPDRHSFQAHLAPTDYNIRAIGKTRAGQLYFSEPRLLKITDSKPVQLSLDTFTSAVRVSGNLDASVPRPIKNGLLVACITTACTNPRAGWFTWNSSVDIHPDGTFEITNLPKPEGPSKSTGSPLDGQLELIATCDGFVSKDPAIKKTEYALGPQIFNLPLSQSITLAMEPLGSARVRVFDPQGKVLAGAIVRFSPTENFRWISTLLGVRLDSEKDQFDESHGDGTAWQHILERYQALTDQDGVAIVKGLPPGIEPYIMLNPPYDMPYRLRTEQSVTEYAQNGIVAVTPGVEASTETKLIPKIEPIQIAGSSSPDGKYVVSVETNTPINASMNAYPYPQVLVIHGAKNQKVVCTIGLPANFQGKGYLINAADPMKIEWNSTSSFFVFFVQRKDHLESTELVVSLEKNDDDQIVFGTTCLPTLEGQIVSVELTGENTFRTRFQLGNGTFVYNYATVRKNGQVSVSSEPAANHRKSVN